MKIRLLLFHLALFLTEAGVAQTGSDERSAKDSISFERNARYVQLYKENAELSYTSPGGEIGAPAKYVINGKLTTTYMLIGTEKLPFALAVIPDFTVRVRNEKSAGVRTPSFRLGATFYYRLKGEDAHYAYTSLSITHHSNGQDGNALGPEGQINTINGNFSTNYLTLKYHFGNEGRFRYGVYSSTNYSMGLEWHKWFDYERAIEQDYGFTRLIYDFSWRKYLEDREHWRLNAAVSYAVNKMEAYQLMILKKRLNAEASFHYALPFMNNVFLMAAIGYYGEDPYNIYYQDRYGYARFGLSSGFLRGNGRK